MNTEDKCHGSEEKCCMSQRELIEQKCREDVQLTEQQLIFRDELNSVVSELESMLIEKNNKYGDSALNPSHTFSSCDAIELINVRIDDKLARIKNRISNDDEDPEWDLMGYLILKRIAVRRSK